VEARLIERFGWTWDQLDEQDEGRTMRAITALNLVGSYQRVLASVSAQNPGLASSADMAAYKMLEDAANEP
jgi:hypothetical protein